jgi:2-amino-4-hydroxy-6-hydroxymethyldihydropteridine diphosphokinase
MRPQALIGLGSNQGDRRAILDAAITSLRRTPGINFIRVSSYHETVPIGGPSGQGPFLNAAALLEPTLDPFQLLDALHHVEDHFGRERVVRWGERTLDIDLLLHGDEIWFTPQLILPHPRFAFRRFVLAPAAEVAPNMVDPMTGQSIAALLENIDRRPSLVCIDRFDTTHDLPASALVASVQDRLCQHLGGVPIQHPVGAASEFDSDPDFHHQLVRAGQVLDHQRWSVTNQPDQWLIADFSLEQQLRRGQRMLRRAALEQTTPASEPSRIDSVLKEANRVVAQALPPTLVVLLEQPGQYRNPLAGFSSPLLIVASDDPDAISEEIATACQATRP